MTASRPIGAQALVVLLEGGPDRVLLIDSRPFVDFNAAHILEAVNVNCSKLMKRRLQQDKVHIHELLQHSSKNKLELQADQEVVVYDHSSSHPTSLSCESFLSVLLQKLEKSFASVHLLSGGFCEFSQQFPGLCEGKSSVVPSCMSQPCLPVSSSGPTRILPHLYLGCQRDVLNQDLMQQNDIVYVLNASNSCPKPDFIPESHFLRVPVNDSFCEKILPWLDRSMDFIEKAKASNSRVLVHCLAGISRSATIAIAYIMKRMDMPLDEAYRFVKDKRPTISPNFNFLGQLLDFERRIKGPPGPESRLKAHGSEAPPQPEQRDPADTDPASAEPLPLPRSLADGPEERRLDEALSGLQLADSPEDSARLKRSFSLDFKSYGTPGGGGEGAPNRVFAPHGTPSGFKEAASKPCQFSPVEEVSEQSPDQEAPPRSQQHLARPGEALKGWHSDILLGAVSSSSTSSSLAAGWYLPPAVLGGCGGGLEAVRRRSRQRLGGREDSRRSWHEESSFEKQLKRRSCQMEFGDQRGDSRSREDMTGGGRSSFSGSMEVIQVS